MEAIWYEGHFALYVSSFIFQINVRVTNFIWPWGRSFYGIEKWGAPVFLTLLNGRLDDIWNCFIDFPIFVIYFQTPHSDQ